MCGITGLFLKRPELRNELGLWSARMLHEMRDRGPDSAGFVVYGEPVAGAKLTLLSETGTVDWGELFASLKAALGVEMSYQTIEDHAVFEFEKDVAADAREWILANAPDVIVSSAGKSMEVFKGVGDPAEVGKRFGLESRTGTHAITHTRMATESAVIIRGSHPFSTGRDTCLVHNGSLSNHNQLRRFLQLQGESFQTENDSEVAAGYLSWRMGQGDNLDAALEHAIEDLDGFYTFAIGSLDGFAVVRDPIACKPAVIAETDDWVAMASEFRAIAVLPDARNANIWEPEPSRIYSWHQTQ